MLNPFGKRFLFPLIFILLYFVVRPFLEGYIGIGILLDVFFSFILVSGVYAAGQRRYLFIIAILIGLPAFLLLWSKELVKSHFLISAGNILMISFFFYMVLVILSYLFRQDEVTADMIMGAVCVYFFLGLMWGFVFSLLEHLQPESFRFGEGLAAGVGNFTYYSFVTQTTLGYGDITPVSTPARSLSLLEAIIGQLYLAVLIARLVGIHISQSVTKGSS